MAAKAVLDEAGMILARLSSNESGRILETILQLMPQEVFETLAYLVVYSKPDDVTRGLIYELVFRIVNKLGMEVESIDPINDAVGIALVMVNCESLRRKGHMEYLAPDNIFTDNPKNPGFNRLTDSGKSLAYKERLDLFNNPKYKM